MNVLLRCRKGHRWESPTSSPAREGYHDLCPVCGEVPVGEAAALPPAGQRGLAPIPFDEA
jgi:hypothetical protein